jgi:chemotaxis protein methyltransferase WspC
MVEAEAILADAIGMDAASIGSDAVHESVRAAWRDSGLADPAAFVAAVRGDDQLRQALVSRVVVPETWFFRDETPFDFLRRHALEWVRTHDGALHVLSAPCASGEEPYSIAITLLEAGLPPDRFVIDAVDVSEMLLDRARRAVYQEPALRKVADARRRRYFASTGDGWQVDDAVRACVSFSRRNLVDPAVVLPRAAYDVIFSRNLLIYLHRAARRQLLATLGRALRPDGVLVVGHAEALAVCEGGDFAIAEGRAFALAPARNAAVRSR